VQRSRRCSREMHCLSRSTHFVYARLSLSRTPSCHTLPRRHASREAGLVGLPNVGKSTLFNALVRSSLAAASNFPFCTITSQSASVPVPDARLARLGVLTGSARVVPWALEVRDIAGLIEGASKGEGLGNAFLADIRGVHAILQVVRCFEDPGVIHVLDTPGPARDIAIIENELILADAQSVEKRLAGARKAAGKSAEAAATLRLLELIAPVLADGQPARLVRGAADARDVSVAWERLQLLTTKPIMYVCNVGEADAGGGGNALTREATDCIAERAAGAPFAVATVCAQVEAELALLPDGAERTELLAAYGLPRSGCDALIEQTAALLGLTSYYTTGPTESRAWPIPVGATAAEAAGVIHSDMQSGFIKADIVGFDELVRAGSEAAARAAGVFRSEGREYVMKAGDVALFKFKA
jgi:GTP-binding protein YchF